MKKLICLMLTAILALSCAACDLQQTNTEAPAAAPEAAEAPAPEAPEAAEPRNAGPFSPEGSVIFEQDSVKVTTAGLDLDPTYFEPTPIVWIDIENAGGEDVFLGVAGGSVNGVMTDVSVNEYYEEDGEYYGGSQNFGTAVPAGETVRRALGYARQNVPGVPMDALDELAFCFTLAPDEWTAPTTISEPVVIASGEIFEKPDIAALGTVVIDSDVMTLVLGDQDYEEWLGPEVYVYIENKSDRCIGVFPDASETDGVSCDYLFGGFRAAPGKMAVGRISFDGEAKELKGFENLSVTFRMGEADSFLDIDGMETVPLEPVSVVYPPQVWGVYENGGLRMEIQPKYNDLVTVETPENDENGVLFSVSETASLEAGGYEGAGWLFSICRVSEEELRELLCYDMIGTDVFAKDGDGNHYLYCHPTDVRYERADAEAMQRDAAVWTMLCEWADRMKDSVTTANGLEYEILDNSYPAMLIARAAWGDEENCYLAATEFMDVDADAADGTPYAAYILQGSFWEITPEELPDQDYLTGENLVLGFPGDGVYLHFYPVDGGYVILDSGDADTIYQVWWNDEAVSVYDAMRGWYYAAAENAGIKPIDGSTAPFLGEWYEKIAGRGMMTLVPSLAPGKVKITVEWPDSAAVQNIWTMTAACTEDGRLVYDNGAFESYETDENGESWMIDGDCGLSGELYISDGGELCWYDAHAGGDGLSTFIR